MAAYTVMFELIDAYQRKTTKTFVTVDTIADEAEAEAASSGLFTDLSNLTEARVLAYTVGRRAIATDSVVTGANKDEGVTFTLEKEDNFNAPIKVPAPINAIFDGEGKVILTHAAVTAFIANFLVGGDFTFNDGEQGTSLVRGSLDK